MGDTAEERLYRLLKKYQCTVTTAESCTGGMIASALVNVPGISEFFTEGYVTYSDAVKTRVLGVPKDVIDTYGVVSGETAAEMAERAARLAGARAALSSTGIAGPDGGTKECPVGLVYLGCYLDGSVVTERHIFAGDRQSIRREAAGRAIAMLTERLEGKGLTR